MFAEGDWVAIFTVTLGVKLCFQKTWVLKRLSKYRRKSLRIREVLGTLVMVMMMVVVVIMIKTVMRL